MITNVSEEPATSNTLRNLLPHCMVSRIVKY